MAPAQADAGPVPDRSGDLPLHAQMAAQLRGAILDGRAPAGTALPSEAALCERYGVARSVVRQALASLAAEGLIRRETGRPAVVAVPQQHRRLVQRSTGFHQQLAQSGVALETRVLGLEPADAPAEVAAFFGTGQLLRLERLRHVGGTPLACAHLAARRPAARAERGAVGERVAARRAATARPQPHSGRNRIRAVAADRTQAGLLDAKPGSPLLMLEGQGLDQHGRPMEWFTTWHRGDQLVFDVDVNDTHESVQPRLRDEPVVPESGQSAAASGDAEDRWRGRRRWCKRCPPNWNACERPAEGNPGASRAKSWIIHPARRGVAMSGPPPVAPCPRLENLPMMRRSAAMSAPVPAGPVLVRAGRLGARRAVLCFRERQGHDQRPDPIAFVRGNGADAGLHEDPADVQFQQDVRPCRREFPGGRVHAGDSQ